MRTRFPGAKNGLKCGRPWMWSQCACESRISALTAPFCFSTSLRPRARIPVSRAAPPEYPPPPDPPHRPAPGLAARADHLGDGMMRGPGGDAPRARLVSEVEQQLGDAAVHVEQHETAHLFVHAAQPAG